MTTLEQQEAQPQTTIRPPYFVQEQADKFEVQVTVPGVSRSGVEVNLEADLLSIRASRTHRTPDGWKVLRRETRDADYALNLRLNVEVDADQIAAKVEDGILRLTLPKAESIRPRSISIN